MRTKYEGREAQLFPVRLRYGAERERYQVLAKDEAARDAKRQRMRHMGEDLCAAGLGQQAKVILEEAAAAGSEQALCALEEEVLRRCERARAEAAEAAARASSEAAARAAAAAVKYGPRTPFRLVAEEMFAAQERRGSPLPDTIKDNRRRLRTVGPVLADKPIGEVTLATAREAMELVAPTITARFLFEGVIFRVLKYAAEMEYIAANPLPQAFVSKQQQPKRLMQYLYVTEEFELIGCRDVPLERRLGYGLQSRESPRPGMLTAFYWEEHAPKGRGISYMNLESGLLTHWHKTDRPRSWPVCDRVLRVLRAWRATQSPSEARVLPGWDERNIAKIFKQDLMTAGQRRRDLHFSSPTSAAITMKDGGRATFNTLAKRAGAPESWITDRTGHTTDEMMARYERMARTTADRVRGWLRPLDEALGAELGLEPLGEPYVVPWLQGLEPAASVVGPTPDQLERLTAQLGQLEQRLAQAQVPAAAVVGPETWPTAAGQEVGQGESSASDSEGLGGDFASNHCNRTRRTKPQNQQKKAALRTSKGATKHRGPADPAGVGQFQGPSGPAPEDPDAGLLRAMERATLAGHFDLAAELLAELRERRLERQPVAEPRTGVTDITVFRSQKKGAAQ